MYECLIKKHNEDGSTSYEYYSNEYDAIPKAPHIKIPEGAEYLLCHEGVCSKEVVFNKNNFEEMWSVTYDDTTWGSSNWDGVDDDRLEYMKAYYDSVVLWKREDKSMNEDIYLLTKLQACEVLLSRTSVLQYQSTDGGWVDFKPSANKSNAQLYTILFNLDDTKFRIKPESYHEPIEFCEVMDMLSEGKYKEVYVNKRQTLNLLNNPMQYLAKKYHDSYSKLIQNNITYDQWKNCKKGEENV